MFVSFTILFLCTAISIRLLMTYLKRLPYPYYTSYISCSMHNEVLLLKLKTLHPEYFLSALHQCKEYYHMLTHTSRTCTGSGMSNEEATKPLHIISSPKMLFKQYTEVTALFKKCCQNLYNMSMGIYVQSTNGYIVPIH